MTHSVRALVALALTLVLGAATARAQNPGLPVYNIGVPRGIGLYGDVAFPNDALGKGVAYGVTGRAGFGLFGATATLSALDPEGLVFVEGELWQARSTGPPAPAGAEVVVERVGDDLVLDVAPLPARPSSPSHVPIERSAS